MKRKSVVHRAKIVVDVGVGSFRRQDRLRAGSQARRRVLPRYDTVPIHTCPHRCSIAVWVEGNQDGVPFAENSLARQLSLSFYGDTRVRLRMCISDDNLKRKSVLHRAKIVVGVGVGSFRRHDRARAWSLARRRDLRRNGNIPLNTGPRRCAIPV